MGFDVLLALTIAYYLTRNTVQDMAWKARGEDPPSYRRERERWERRQAKRAAGDGPGRKFWRNVWSDAVASADERRARMAERAAERRRRKWADADLEAAEAEAREINDRLRATTETVYTCGGCDRQISQSEVAGYALSGDPLCRDCRTAAPTPAGSSRSDEDGPTYQPDPNTSVVVDPKPAPQAAPGTGSDKDPDGDWLRTYRRDEWAYAPDGQADAASPTNTPHHCERCGTPAPMSSLVPRGTGTARNGEDEFCLLCAACAEEVDQQTRDRAEDTYQRLRDAAHDQTHPQEDPDPNSTPATVTDLNAWRSKGATPPITKEDIVSGETTNLAAALNYTQEMADKCGAGAASTETSIATLRAADVSGPVMDQLALAQDLLTQTMAAFNAAHADLTSQLAVKDAYMANQGAGDKQFQMQD